MKNENAQMNNYLGIFVRTWVDIHMATKSYFCPSCGFKSPSEQGLIPAKGGCTSCGKSGYKCPRCSMAMRIVRQAVSKFTVIGEKVYQQPIARKEQKFVARPTYERPVKAPKINRY